MSAPGTEGGDRAVAGEPVTYPVSLDLRGRRVVVVGGGTVAADRVRRLVETGARVRVVAPRVVPELEDRRARGEIEILPRAYRRGDLDGAFLVLAERVGRDVQQALFDEAERLGTPVNIEDDPARCSFHVPSRVRRGHLQVAISTGGRAPAVAVRLRQELESLVTEARGKLVDLAGSFRAEVSEALPDFQRRRRAWYRLADSVEILAMLRDDDLEPARRRARQVLGLDRDEAPGAEAPDGDPGPPPPRTGPRSAPRSHAGSVHLVGAGPGDPELITVRGRHLLETCDVVVHDRLANPVLLDVAPTAAERIFVGKAPGVAALDQRDIETVLIDRARRGLRVVRLKGGDPFVFGRGGEEALALVRARVPWEIVPAVSSALAVPARAGIPLTHRGVAASFAVVTGHRTDDGEEPDWEALARVDTLVVLMGVARLETVVARLLAAGRAAATPVAIVERGTLPEERVVTAPLGWICRVARHERVSAPATVVVGPVAALTRELCPTAARPIDPTEPETSLTPPSPILEGEPLHASRNVIASR